ncbi:MAG TPA: M35 family metallo-endopeptidase [Candidatus Limnocylindrales bacterium]|jgi:RHS repeat-associated protein|nr:M35 family metallo-endopeptidase [Candidatus Limnocylindrales bacterium]
MSSCRQSVRFSLAIIVWTFSQSLESASVTATIYVGPCFEVRDHEQPTKFLFNGDTRVAEITGSISPNTRLQRLHVYTGWNLVSLAVTADDLAGQCERNEPGGLEAAYKWNPATKDYSALSPVQTIWAGTVLWIKAARNTTFGILGTYNDPSVRPIETGGAYLTSGGLEAWFPMLTPNASGWTYDAETKQWQTSFGGHLSFGTAMPLAIDPGHALYIETSSPIDLEMPDPSLRIRYYHEDHLGSSTAITDAMGAIVEEASFFPFGTRRHDHVPRGIAEPYQFIQKERDVETGLNHLEARYLASAVSRFATPDPKYTQLDGLPADELTGTLSMPQRMNLYAYVVNNPLRYSDPTGLDGCGPTEPGITKLSADQQKVVLKAKDEAVAALEGAIAVVDAHLNACSSAEQALEKWFGPVTAQTQKSVISKNLHKIYDNLKTFSADNFLYDQNWASPAYTCHDDPSHIYIGAKFFGYQDSGFDSKMGTLVHEGSHPDAVAHTDDVGNKGTLEQAKFLAGGDDSLTLKNAGNYEAFVEAQAQKNQVRDQAIISGMSRVLRLQNSNGSK